MGPGVHARIEEYAELLRDAARAMDALPSDIPRGAGPGRADAVRGWLPGTSGGQPAGSWRRLGAADLNEEWAFRGIHSLRGGHGRGLHPLLDPRLRAAAPRRDGDRARVPGQPRGWPLRARPPLLLGHPVPELRRDQSNQVLDLGGFEDRSPRSLVRPANHASTLSGKARFTISSPMCLAKPGPNSSGSTVNSFVSLSRLRKQLQECGDRRHRDGGLCASARSATEAPTWRPACPRRAPRPAPSPVSASVRPSRL